jgi:hypothetical protein
MTLREKLVHLLPAELPKSPEEAIGGAELIRRLRSREHLETTDEVLWTYLVNLSKDS